MELCATSTITRSPTATESKHGYILPKQMIMMVVEVMDDIESGRIDPKDHRDPGMVVSACRLGKIVPGYL